MRLALLFLGLAVGTSAGCQLASVFVCAAGYQCELGGVQGTCEDTGYCSFPDDDCESGMSYGEHAGDGLAGECVPVDSGGGSGSDDDGGTDTGGSTVGTGDGSTTGGADGGTTGTDTPTETGVTTETGTFTDTGSTSDPDTTTGTETTTSTTSSTTTTSTTSTTTTDPYTTETFCATLANQEQLLDTTERTSMLWVSIPGDPVIVDLDVSITAYHTQIGDVRFELRSPQWFAYEIVSYWSCPWDGYDVFGPNGAPVVLDDEAPDDLSVGCTIMQFVPGTYRPNGSALSTFDGVSVNGSWQLYSQATFWPGYQGGDVLWDPQVFEWCLTITY